MIKGLRANDPRFKAVSFTPGFNVVLADTTDKSSEKESRNGLGKSTLINLIHFCLGSNLESVSDLVVKELADWEFSLDFTADNLDLTVVRGFKPHSKVTVFGDWDKLPLPEKALRNEDSVILSISDWNSILGNLMFDLPVHRTTNLKYKPTFRSLISYFSRRTPSAYLSPFSFFREQQTADIQITNCFLLDLHWEDAAHWQTLKDKSKELDKLKKQAESGLLPGMDATVGELEAKKIRLEEQVNKDRNQLSDFQINPQYEQIERDAGQLTQNIHELNEENLQDQRLSVFYQSSLKDEKPPSSEYLLKVYEEARIELPGLVKKRFEDVEKFHSQVIQNRQKFLNSEILRLKHSCEERREKIEKLDTQRRSLMKIIQTEGALEEYLHLQNKLSEKVVKLKSLEKQIDDITALQKGKSALKIQLEQLFIKAQTDFIERKQTREKAIKAFNHNSDFLYDHPVELVIYVTKSVFKFDIKMARGPSEGFQQMKVFCYDLMLSELWSTHKKQPGFLIHDSTIFGDVDERQKAHALLLAKNKSEELGFQYICTLNSDMIPWDDLKEHFSLLESVRLTLTDEDAAAGLLGLRIDAASDKSSLTVDEDSLV